MAVSHIGSLALHSPHRTFTLRDTLCVPNLCKNLISFHHLTKQNNVFVEFHPFYFLVKDKISGAILLKEACNNGIYTFPESIVASKKVANVHERTSIDGWHKRLRHPSIKIVHHLVKKISLPISSTKNLSSLCHSCSINKAHQQPFRVNSLQSHEPLELIYTDVWGPASYTGIDGSRYYLILLIIIQNIYGFIQWSLNPMFLKFFHISNVLLKPAFKNQSKHYTPTMVVSLLL